MLKYISIILFAFTIAKAETYPPTLGSMSGFVLFENRIPLPPHPPLQTKNGTELNLNNFNGTVTLVNFWAPWCAPCRRELPSFSKLQKKYDPLKMKVVIIDVNASGRKRGDRYLSKNKNLSNLLNLYQENALLYQILGANGALPITYIIDKNSKLVGYFIGETHWHGKDTAFLLDHLIDEPHIN